MNTQLIFKTKNDYGPLILRAIAGTVMLAHGAQKLLGLFGGFGFGGTMQFFTQTMHFPWIIGFLVIFIEFFGSLALILGLATRLVSVALIIVITGIICTTNIHYGFFMNWFGLQKGEGIEFSLLFFAITVSLLLSGGGKWSADRLVVKESSNRI